jgi:IclR family KDG regulon transcriptional repressor
VKVARTTTGKYVVEAVAKALDIVEAFNNSEELPLNEISKRVGLNKSRTFRLLSTLVDRGYVARNVEGSRYRLGVELLQRASNVHRDLRQIARDYMVELQQRLNETVNLSVLDDEGNVLYLDIAESSRPFRMTASVGSRIPCHVTSMGKAMIAYMRIDDPKSPYHSFAAKLSPRPSRALYRELAQIRERGYAIDREGNEAGVGCIGAPIFDAMGRPVAGMSVAGPLPRIIANQKRIAELLVNASQHLSRNLGFPSSRTHTSPCTRLRRVAAAK